MLEVAEAVGSGAAALVDVDGMQLALDVAAPELEESVEFGKFGGEVEFLPDEGLEQRRVVRQAVNDLGRRQPIAPGLELEEGHVAPHVRSVASIERALRHQRSHAIVNSDGNNML